SARNRSGTRLLLGGTPWLAELLRREYAPSFVVDQSAAMLSLAARRPWEQDAMHAGDDAQIFLKANWLALPDLGQPVDIVIGDNSFSFLTFPGEWAQLRDELARRMRAGAKLVIRVCSVPHGHRAEAANEVAERFLASTAPVNFTEVRAALLFAQWNPRTYAIKTEEALQAFRSGLNAFVPLIGRRVGANDLETICKYEGTG